MYKEIEKHLTVTQCIRLDSGSAVAYRALCQHFSFSSSTVLHCVSGRQVLKSVSNFNQLHLWVSARRFSPKGFSFSTVAQMKCLILLNIKMNCISGLLTIANNLYIMKFLSVSNVNIFIVSPSPVVFRGGSGKKQAFFNL